MAKITGMGQDGRRFHLPVDGGSTIADKEMVAQLVATGQLVPAGTAGAGPCIGVATHDADNSGGADDAIRCLLETDRVYIIDAAAGSTFTDDTLIGARVFLATSTTVHDSSNSGARLQCGVFMGMEADGRVRVWISSSTGIAAGGSGPTIQAGVGTFAAGVLTVNSGITVTSTSRVFMNRVTEAGTDGDEIRCPAADRTAGGPGTGALTFRSFLDGVAATSDTSTFEYLIVG